MSDDVAEARRASRQLVAAVAAELPAWFVRPPWLAGQVAGLVLAGLLLALGAPVAGGLLAGWIGCGLWWRSR